MDFTTPYMQSGIATVIKRPPEGFPLPFESPRELVNQTRIQYGCIPGSLTQSFFRTTMDTDYRKMYHIMSTSLPSVFEWTSRKGIARVRESNGRYVFFLESVFANFLVGQPPCDIQLLDTLLNPSYYAFATQKGSNLTKKINRAITQLKEAGVIQKLNRRWWKNKCRKRNNIRDDLKDESHSDKSRTKDVGEVVNSKERLTSKEEVEEDSTPAPRGYVKVKTRVISLSGSIGLHIDILLLAFSSALALCSTISFV